jgi:hypothetical protein
MAKICSTPDLIRLACSDERLDAEAVRVFNDDGGLPETGLRLIIDEAKKTAKVEREIPLNEIADLSILREAQKELGISPK